MTTDNYVGYCRYIEHPDYPTRIVLCDSDTPGAFKVYRHAAAPSQESAPQNAATQAQTTGDGASLVQTPAVAAPEQQASRSCLAEVYAERWHCRACGSDVTGPCVAQESRTGLAEAVAERLESLWERSRTDGSPADLIIALYDGAAHIRALLREAGK